MSRPTPGASANSRPRASSTPPACAIASTSSLAETDAAVAAIFVDGQPVEQADAGQEVEILLPETIFYVETGGQVGDTGEIYYWPEDLDAPVWAVQVTGQWRRPCPA